MSLVNKKESKKESMYVKNSVDYSSYDCCEENDMLTDSECLDLLDDCVLENEITSIPLSEDINELLMLGFFNEFALMDIGIGDFIREIYFED